MSAPRRTGKNKTSVQEPAPKIAMDIPNTGVVIIAFANNRKINGTAQHSAVFWRSHVVRHLQWRGCFGGLGEEPLALENSVFFFAKIA